MILSELSDLIVRNRSYRRFHQTPRPGRERLETWLDCVRLAASGGNRQPLRFRLIHDPAECAAVFPLTRWAGLLKEWSPAADEAPTAYVLVLAAAGGATPQTDAGIAMQTLLLAAVADGFGGCMLGAIDRPAIRAALNLPAALELLYAVALGKPAETCRLEAAIDGQTAYYRSADGIHHVPKLPLEALLVPED
ncbi:MAG: nitroreductase family protein [Lentisphaerae bacterium]|nr:nitroreductase family protein [Lentisphaerota bacterium]